MNIWKGNTKKSKKGQVSASVVLEAAVTAGDEERNSSIAVAGLPDVLLGHAVGLGGMSSTNISRGTQEHGGTLQTVSQSAIGHLNSSFTRSPDGGCKAKDWTCQYQRETLKPQHRVDHVLNTREASSNEMLSSAVAALSIPKEPGDHVRRIGRPRLGYTDNVKQSGARYRSVSSEPRTKERLQERKTRCSSANRAKAASHQYSGDHSVGSTIGSISHLLDDVGNGGQPEHALYNESGHDTGWESYTQTGTLVGHQYNKVRSSGHINRQADNTYLHHLYQSDTYQQQQQNPIHSYQYLQDDDSYGHHQRQLSQNAQPNVYQQSHQSKIYHQTRNLHHDPFHTTNHTNPNPVDIYQNEQPHDFYHQYSTSSQQPYSQHQPDETLFQQTNSPDVYHSDISFTGQKLQSSVGQQISTEPNSPEHQQLPVDGQPVSTVASNGEYGYQVSDLEGLLSQSSAAHPANLPMVLAAPTRLHHMRRTLASASRPFLPLGVIVNAVFKTRDWLYVRTAHGAEGFVPYHVCLPLGILPPSSSNTTSATAAWELSSPPSETQTVERGRCRERRRHNQNVSANQTDLQKLQPTIRDIP